TEIDFDHTEHLGSTLSEIAIEKACIMKPDVPCLAYSQDDQIMSVLGNHAIEVSAPFFELSNLCTVKRMKCTESSSVFDVDFNRADYTNLKIPLVGRFQINNAALAVAATQILSDSFELERHAIYEGLRNVSWPGRLQKLQENPTIVVDVAHNLGAISHLFATLSRIYEYHHLIVVVGLLKDKNYAEIAKVVVSKADMIFTVTPASDRALDAHIFASELPQYSSSQVIDCSTQHDAFLQAISNAEANDLICITGSHYVVADFMKFFKKA
ncbi:MAG: bifunctional folylpolyglutamate synthase/dihydrofolate synthase, partial [bacterium]